MRAIIDRYGILVDPRAATSTPGQSLERAVNAIALAYHLREIGWYKHQHRADVCRTEHPSTPFIGPLTLDTILAIRRCQELVDSQCFAPPPDLSISHTPWKTGPTGGLRLDFATDERPAEATFTHTHELEPDKAAVLWKAIVDEVATAWATTARHVQSAGRVFLGPKNRFIFWPKHLNKLLAKVTVAYGRVLDLLSVLAAVGVKMDIKSAYRALRLDPDDVPFHGAIVDSVHVCFERLSFGMAQSPAMFTFALGVTIDTYRDSLPATRAALAQFVDDSGVSGTDIPITILAAERLLRALRSDGWWLAAAKTFVYPATTLCYTGFLVEFAARTLRVDPAKAAKATAALDEVTRPTDRAIEERANASAPTVPEPATARPTHPPATLSSAWCPDPPACSAPAAPKWCPDPPGAAAADATRFVATDSPSLTRRQQLIREAISQPGQTTALALGSPISGDIIAPTRCRIVRGPLPLAPCDNLTVVGEHIFTNQAGIHQALRAAADAASHDREPVPIFAIIPPGVRNVAHQVTRDFRNRQCAAPVVFFTPTASTTTRPPAHWCDPSYALPPHMPRTANLPTPTSMPPAPPQKGDRLDINEQEFLALTKVLGYLAWFQTALPFVSFWRAALTPLAHDGVWTADRAAAFDAVSMVLRVIGGMACRVDPGRRKLCVVTDASGSGWGATVHFGDRVVYLAGALPDHVCVGSSTLREAVGAVSAIRAAMDLGVPFDSVEVKVDNASLASAGTSGRVKAEPLAHALWPLAAWAAQGLQVSFSWHARSDSRHTAPDALSAATGPAPWPLRPEVASRLWDWSGGWDIDVAAYRGQDGSWAPRYATPSLSEATSSDRRRILDGIQPQNEVGWSGTTSSTRLAPSQVAFAHPLWSHLRELVAWWRSAPCRLVLVAPAAGSDWWAPFLAELDTHTVRSLDLPHDSTLPPVPGATADPRPLRARLLAPPAAAAGAAAPPPPPTQPPRPPPRWYVPPPPASADPNAYRSAFGTPAQTAWVLGGHCPRDRPSSGIRRLLGRHASPSPDSNRTRREIPTAARRRPTSARRLTPPTSPTHSDDHPPPVRGRQRLVDADPAVPSTTPAARPRPDIPPPHAPPPARARSSLRRILGTGHTTSVRPADRQLASPARHRAPGTRRPAPPSSAGIPRGVSPQRSAPAEPRRPGRSEPSSPPHATAAAHRAAPGAPAAAAACGGSDTRAGCAPRRAFTTRDWLRDILLSLGGRPTSLATDAGPTAAAPAHAPAAARARNLQAQQANSGSGAPVQVASLALDFARHRGVEDHPWSLEQADAFMLDFVQARSGSGSRPASFGAPVRVKTADANASALAAASRRAGWMVPGHCGPNTAEWLRGRGAGAKPENSAAFPLHLRTLIELEPDAADPTWSAWAALVLMSAFGLRTGVVYHTWSDMFIPYNGGYIFVWRHVHKRTARVDDAADIEALSAIGAVSGARHPVLHRIIRHAEGNHRLFPGVTSEHLSNFVRRVYPKAPPGFDIRPYGGRVAADHDATTLALPDDLTHRLFWWKRRQQDMRIYYSGINIELMFLFTERRARIDYTCILPGTHDAVIAPGRKADLKWGPQVLVGRKLPPAPDLDLIRRALDCKAPSIGAARVVRAAVRAKRARRAAGLDDTESCSDPGPAAGTCCLCSKALTADDDGATCIRCDMLACTSCWPELDRDFRCPAHREPPASRRRVGPARR